MKTGYYTLRPSEDPDQVLFYLAPGGRSFPATDLDKYGLEPPAAGNLIAPPARPGQYVLCDSTGDTCSPLDLKQ